jgi:hypothetical protein
VLPKIALSLLTELSIDASAGPPLLTGVRAVQHWGIPPLQTGCEANNFGQYAIQARGP